MAGKKKAETKSKDKNADAKGGKGKGQGKGLSGQTDSNVKVRGAQSINARHIYCVKHSKKEEALAKLKTGAHFDVVAREFSEDKARQSGALGWQTKGKLDAKFEEVAYALETSTTETPKIGEAKSAFGYHIIMVEGRR